MTANGTKLLNARVLLCPQLAKADVQLMYSTTDERGRMLDLGSTDDLSANLWYFAIAPPWGFYFLHWTAGRLRM